VKPITQLDFAIEDMVKILEEVEPGKRECHIKIAETRIEYGPAYTFVCGGQIIACAGVTIYWPGVGEVWLCPSIRWLEYKEEIVPWTRKILNQLQTENKLWRIQADVVASDARANRFIKLFGFKLETPEGMKMYDALGRDCNRYSRVRMQI
jgi:hypothetical protein